ncbi:MAG: GNAT family N-acetyltransferase [Burkholderiales bacterium]
MTRPNLIVADIALHRAKLLELNVEYVSWVFSQVEAYFGVRSVDILGMPADAYVATVIDKICGRKPPEGVFYLVEVDGRLAAMGGLRGLDGKVAEIKRVYVRPQFRGHRLGEAILDTLMRDARAFGYETACLDTAPFMKTAHRLYESAGFTDRPPYAGVEVPPEFHAQWRFMERPLANYRQDRTA